MSTDGLPLTSNTEILVVEDNPASMKMILDLLTKAGYRTRPASDGELGLRSVQAKKPDLILLDFKMPGINGVEVCRQLKNNPNTCDIPVIFISALGDSKLKVTALGAGAVDYVTKPIESSEVLARINTHLSMYQMQRKLEVQTKELERHREQLEVLVEERTAKLRDSEIRSQLALDGADLGTWDWNIQTGHVMFNERWAEMLGYRQDEIKPDLSAWKNLIHPDDMPGVEEALNAHLEGRTDRYETEHRLLHKSGEWVWVLDKGRVIERGTDGKPLRACGTHLDITERKQAEEERERILRLSSDLICTASPDGYFKFLNPAWEKALGYSIEELLKRPFLDFIHPDDHKKNDNEIASLSEGNDTLGFENRYICKDGFIRTISWSATFLPETQVMYCIGRDVTERKRAEKSLRDSEQRNRAWIDHSPVCTKIVDLDFKLRFMSAAGARSLNIDDITSYYGESYPFDFYPESFRNRMTKNLTKVKETNEVIVQEASVVDLDGRELWFHSTLVPVCDEEGQIDYIMVVSVDTTVRKHAEEKIVASLKEKEVLLREIHHRVKNNMQVIISLLRMHARESSNEQVRSVFNDCRDRVNAMSLIHEVLYQSEDLARIDSEPYLTKLCRNLSQVHGASSKGIVCIVQKENVSLGVDQAVAVGTIVCELISNVFKHAFLEGELGNVSVSLSYIDEEEVELIVQDDGVGLSPEIDILNTPSLGLHLVAITTTHELGGTIEVERDGGTRFVIHFKHKDN